MMARVVVPILFCFGKAFMHKSQQTVQPVPTVLEVAIALQAEPMEVAAPSIQKTGAEQAERDFTGMGEHTAAATATEAICFLTVVRPM